MLAVESTEAPADSKESDETLREKIAPDIRVRETREREYLRRWMLRPSIVRKIAGQDCDSFCLAQEFDAIMASRSRFFSVHVNGTEKGCVIFKPTENLFWEMHLCLFTWFPHTRQAIMEAINLLSSKYVVAKYDASRRAVNVLLDDLGFEQGVLDGLWRIRKLTLTK